MAFLDSNAAAGDRIEVEQSAPVRFEHALVALDASAHGDRALAEIHRLVKSSNGAISGIHAYAAKMHDRRFKQMEGGLPEKYLREDEMERQRDIHDDLISRGLNIISDSYHDTAERILGDGGTPYYRLNAEGKNYRRILETAETGHFSVLAIGALGLGAIPGSLIGTVCERVARRAPIDLFVAKDPDLAIGDGPVVACVDGSAKSFGALLTAIDIAERLGTELHIAAAYDPYYHYVAFNKIAGALSEEAGKVFRFKEQEQLHEEIIDDGLAKIYQSHLEVAKGIARDRKQSVTAELLDGKPFRAIVEYLRKVSASLVVLGRTGVHADALLDIGGNAENILRSAPCHVWLGQVEHAPEIDRIAEQSIAWSAEAEVFLAKAPEFVQGMARQAIQRHAHDQGHSFITTDIVIEVMAKMMPGGGGSVGPVNLAPPPWSTQAEKILAENVSDPSIVDNVRRRAEKKAKRESAEAVRVEHVRPFIETAGSAPLIWTAAALARLARVPEMVREQVGFMVEDLARERTLGEISLELAEESIEEARKRMCPIQ